MLCRHYRAFYRAAVFRLPEQIDRAFARWANLKYKALLRRRRAGGQWLCKPKDAEPQHACLPDRFSRLSCIAIIFALGENLEMKVDAHFQQMMPN